MNCIPGILYLAAKEISISKKILIIQGLIASIFAATKILMAMPYEFRLFGLIVYAIPMLYLGFIGTYYEDVRIERELDEKEMISLQTDIIATCNFANFRDVDECISRIKKMIIEEMKLELTLEKKIIKNRKKLYKEFKNTEERRCANDTIKC